METKYAVTGGEGCNFCTHAAVFESNGNAVLSLHRSSPFLYTGTQNCLSTSLKKVKRGIRFLCSITIVLSLLLLRGTNLCTKAHGIYWIIGAIFVKLSQLILG